MDNGQRRTPVIVAVASKSGVFVDECFGRAAEYRLYQWDGETFRPAGIRPGPAPCRDGSHDHGLLVEAIEAVADCGVVLAGRIGPEAVRLLALRGIRGLSTRIGIEDALKRLAGTPAFRARETFSTKE